MKIIPKKSLGQVFLKSKGAAQRVVQSIRSEEKRTVLEIGPGKGILTEYLIDLFQKVIAVEIDSRLVEYLTNKFGEAENLVTVNSDFLEFKFNGIVERDEKVVVVGNLPYNVSSPILFKLFENRRCISECVLMFQREVAERVAGKNGNRGILTLLTEYYGKAEYLFKVKKNLFRPVPDVDSAVIRITFRSEPLENVEFHEEFFPELLKITFGKRRKMLRNSLKYMENLKIENIEKEFDLTRRPEELSLAEFIRLGNLIYTYGFEKN